MDGPAIFDNVRDCQISVASQQFQVRNSTATEFGLYCATKPTIEHSRDLRFTCWMGAYPGLTEHFHKANLDPKVNQWDKVRMQQLLRNLHLLSMTYTITPLRKAMSCQLASLLSCCRGSRFFSGSSKVLQEQVQIGKLLTDVHQQ